MCVHPSANLQNGQLRHSSKSEAMIARLTEAIDKALSSSYEETPQDSALEALSSSLECASITFGIFDSLTLARKRVPTKSNENANQVEPEEEDILMSLDHSYSDDDEEDEIDAAWREFDCSWESFGSRRSGVRRGYKDEAHTETKMIVPTKSFDGPSTGLVQNDSVIQ